MTKEEKKLNFKEIDNKCEDCGKKDESVIENLILSGFKKIKVGFLNIHC